MFFERRRWAVRLIDEMGMFAGTRTSSVLIELLIWASKLDAPEAKPFGTKQRDKIIGWGIIMFNNPTAAEKLARDALVSEADAYALLRRMNKTAGSLARTNGLTTLIEIADSSATW
jgi:hypothetical protein